MLLHLLHSVERAIQSYENAFGPDRPMSLRRAQDIIELRSLLRPSQYENCQIAIGHIQARLDQVQTGWWIFHTGRSQLKQHITRVLNYFRDDATAILFDTVQDISTSLEYIPALIHLSSRPKHDDIEQLHIEMRTLNETNQQLQRRIAELERENSALLHAKRNANINQPAQSAQPLKEKGDDNDETAAEVGRAPQRGIN